ncbi:HU family DNA-binding protein [Prevotella sp.]|uniref:HU family DNA-binding protein n=1 Tax=Prevotella sp. TaxID=59823 RepID=UPI002F91DEE3
MNNKEFISELAQRSGLTQADTQKLVNSIIDRMMVAFDSGEDVNISSFGVFELKKRLERVVNNPSTGLKMLVPPKIVLNFKPNSSVKERLKNGKAVYD